jgi:hypothetical protein
MVVGFATTPAAVLNAIAPASTAMTYAAVATAEWEGVPAAVVSTQPCAFRVVSAVKAGIAVADTKVPVSHDAPLAAHAGVALVE